MAIKPFNSIGGISLGTDSRQALNADGSANFASLEVGNTANLNGQVFVNNTLAVSNAASFGETVLINGVLTATANVDVQAELNVTGNIVTLANMGVGGDLSTTGNLSVTGTSTLGDVGNVHISGGASGQYLQTNGSGNLSWVTLDTDTLANGSSNVSIDSTDGPVTIGVNGSSNIAKFNQSNIEFTDGTNTAFTFDLAAKFLTMIDAADNQVGVAPTEIALNSTNGDYMTQLLSGAWSLSSSIDAGMPQTYITPGFISTYYGDIGGGPVMPTNPDHLTTKAYVDNKGYIANGTSSVEIPTADGNIALTVGGTLIATVSNAAVTMTGNLDITGNVNVTGNLNYQNVTDMVVGDPLIFIGANNAADLFDLGFSASYNNGATVHTGFARDATDGIWKLFDGVATEPTTTIDFAGATFAGFQAGAASLASAQVDGLIETDTLTVVSGADLGDVSTLTIDGGNAGDVLTTDGAGVVSWVPLASTASKMDTLSGSFTSAGGIAYSAALPSGAVIDQVLVIVDSVFDGAPAVEVGVTGNTGKYVASTDSDLTVADRYEFPQSYTAGSGETVDVKVTNGGATVGAGRVIIHYSIPA